MALEKAFFGAGCFWHVEHSFRGVPGVAEVFSGFMGGSVKNPSYEQVCSGNTGHVEVVEVVFDSSKVSYDALLDFFWGMHDPTQFNRQGPDFGEQYRSVIFYANEGQRLAAEKSKEMLEASGRFKGPVVTSIEPAKEFFRAEEYHQRYLEKHGSGSCPV